MPAERIAMRQVREVLRLKFVGGVSDQRDRPPDRRGAVDSARDDQALPGRRAELAAAGRADRRRAGSEALPRCRHQAGPPASGRARLGEHPSRAQAQARHAVDPVGRVHRARSGRLPLLALLRALPRLGRQALGHDAPDPCGRRQAVRRLRRRHGAGDRRPADRRDAPGADLRRRAWARRASPMPRRPGRKRSATGSAPTRAPSRRSAACRVCIVPDNAKVAVIKACLYEPQVNRTYAEMAAHYGTAMLPTRPRRPRDKAKVEACVLIVERWLLGRLRDRRFYSLAELNAAIGELLERLNEERPIRRLGVTRRQLLEELDRPALKPLPTEPYVFAEWRVRRVGIDYHVDVEGHFYSVPYRFARSEVEVRLTGRTVEIFVKGERIAAHMRSSGNGKHTTAADHMPSSHRRYADWTIEPHPQRRRLDRPGHRGALRADPGAAAASRTGLPLLPRHPAAGAAVRRRASGSRRHARHRDRRAHLRLGPLHPRPQARSTRRTTARRGRRADPPFQHPRPALLPIGDQALLTHPTLDQLHQLGLAGMAKAFGEIEASGEAAALDPSRMARLCCSTSEASYRRDKRLHARLRYARLRHQAAVEDVDYRAARGLDRALFQKLAEGDWIDAHDNSDPVRADRRRQKLACLGARPQGLPRQSLRPLPARPQALRRSRARPRRRSLCPHPASARRRAAAHPRRLGARAARCRRPSRPARDPRRTLRPPLDHHHQPDPRRQMARADRRSRPTPTPSSIASSTTPTGSISPATACDAHAPAKPSKD